jgi:hypothetical protein
MLATFLVGSTALFSFLFAAKAREDASLVPSWFDLVEDCRTSVESREPLFMLNVLPTGASPDPVRVIGMSRAKMWAPLGGGGRFAIMEHEDDAPSGVFRGCEVVLADWHRPLSRLEIERLTFAFIEQRNLLLYQRAHEADDIEAMPNLTSLAFRTTSPNPDGCRVVTAMFAEPDEGDFRVVVGEQREAECVGGVSLMKPST